MDEFVFPIAAVALTFLVLIPLCTLISRAVLARKRRRITTWVTFGSQTTFAWLVAPTLLPFAWLTSAALHQIEELQAAESCLVDHLDAACLDALVLAVLLIGGFAGSLALRAWRERPRLRLAYAAEGAPLAVRIARIVAGDERLSRMAVRVVQHAPTPVFTCGWFRPKTFVDACFARRADDEMLRAALLHERAHVDAYDTLRGFIVRLSLALNPAGRLLAHDFARWRRAREAQCDSDAVTLGGEPLALAEGIVHAARFSCAGPTLCGAVRLCGHDVSVLKLRVALLLEGPRRTKRTFGHITLLAALIAAVALPHVEAVDALEHLHIAAERLFHSLH